MIGASKKGPNRYSTPPGEITPFKRPRYVMIQAEKAWDSALSPARLTSQAKTRIPYPEAARNALEAYKGVLSDYDESSRVSR